MSTGWITATHAPDARITDLVRAPGDSAMTERVKVMTDTQQWMPTIGACDLALLVERYRPDGIPFSGADPFEVRHAAIGGAIVYGLARHATLFSKKPVFVEIGVAGGNTTALLLHLAEQVDGHVIGMDPAMEPSTPARLQRLGCNLKRWTMHHARSQDVEPVEADFLYVDGDHGYEAVCSDMARHGAAVRVGGGILFDDFHVQWPGKTRWLVERWADVQPITIGPYAYFVRRSGAEELYRSHIDLQPNGTMVWVHG